MTARRVLIQVNPRAEEQIHQLPERLRVRVRLALLDLLDNPLPLAEGAGPFEADGDAIPDAYEWDIGGVTIFYNLIEPGPLFVQVVLIDAL